MNINRFKKLLFLFLLGIGVFFINNGRVEAAPTKCTYKLGNNCQVTYILTPTTDGSATISTNLTNGCEFASSGNRVSSTNFINDQNKTIKCLSEMNYKLGYNYANRKTVVEVDAIPFTGQTGNAPLSSSENNPQALITTSSRELVRTCQGKGQNGLGTDNSSMPTVYIKVFSDGTLEFESSNSNYTVKADSDVNYDLFKDECKTVKVNCGNNFCQIQYGNVLREEERKETEETKTEDKIDNESDDSKSTTLSGNDSKKCSEVLGENVTEDINNILSWIRIIVPILVIVLGTVDFAKAVLSDDQKSLSKATSTLVKRLIAAVAIFFVPIIVKYLIELVNNLGKIAIGCEEVIIKWKI